MPATDSFLDRAGDAKRVTRDRPYPTTPGGGATVARVALTDTSQQTLVAAPTGGKSIYVYGLFGSNAGGSLSTIDVKEGTTAKFSFAAAANGGGFACPLSRAWKLPADTALTVQQSAAVNSFASAIYEVE
jgi:hypothetical protein